MFIEKMQEKFNFESEIHNHFFTDAIYLRAVSRGGRYLSSMVIMMEEVHTSKFTAIKDIGSCSDPFRLKIKENIVPSSPAQRQRKCRA